MPAGVGRSQANQSCARVRVKMRRTLTHQVWSPQEAVRSGWEGSGLCRKALVSITPIFISSRAEAVTKPSQGKARRLRYSHQVPTTRHGMTESVQPSFGIKSRTIGRREHNSRCSDGCAHRTRRHDSHAHGSGSLVSGTGHNRSTRLQTGSSGSTGRDFPADFGRLKQPRQQRLVHAGRLQHFMRPPAVGDIQQQGTGCVCHVSGSLTGKPEADVVLGQHHRPDPFPILRFALAHP